jgi:NADPH:quinone reductase-like Zn-dependent oxidoreductase
MKAIAKIRSGPPEVLPLREVERPTPRPDEVLIRIRAATVTRDDVVLTVRNG